VTSRESRVGRYLDDLLQNVRPRRFRARPEELEAMRAAVRLVSARAGADQGPDPAFLDRLGRRLRAELEGEPEAAQLNRRRLLGSAGALAAVAAAGAAAGAITDNLLVTRGASQPPELVPVSGRWIAVAASHTLQDGEPLPFNTGAVEGFVFR